jgi:predicted ATPase with chaperone activity
VVTELERPVQRPEAPTSIAETGLDPGFLADLALKTLYFGGNISGGDLCDRLALPLNVVAEVLLFLRKQRLAETTGGSGLSEATLQYALSNSGIERAVAALSMSGYVGPAPVPLAAYFEQVKRQSVLNVEISREEIEQSLSTLVYSERTTELLGQAISSKRATMIYGASGNGKSTAAEALRSALPGDILIPYSVEVMHQVIQLYDHTSHVLVEDGPRKNSDGRYVDRRWLIIKRPVVVAAGELAPSHLELIMDDNQKTYEAPIQMKANGGVLVIDDFGRQHLDAAYLLNRWIVPLEKGLDNLSLRNGARFQTPFDVIPLFVTNKVPADLADEGFLRRIRYKVEVPSPTPELFLEILQRECNRNDVQYDERAAKYLLEKHFQRAGRELRGCQPRDIVEGIAAAARYRGAESKLTVATIDAACANYFV